MASKQSARPKFEQLKNGKGTANQQPGGGVKRNNSKTPSGGTAGKTSGGKG